VRRDLERLNHVLIPATKSERDRWRNSRLARRARPLLWMITRLTREGRVVLVTVGLAAVFAIDVGRTETHLLVFALAKTFWPKRSVTLPTVAPGSSENGAAPVAPRAAMGGDLDQRLGALQTAIDTLHRRVAAIEERAGTR